MGRAASLALLLCCLLAPAGAAVDISAEELAALRAATRAAQQHADPNVPRAVKVLHDKAPLLLVSKRIQAAYLAAHSAKAAAKLGPEKTAAMRLELSDAGYGSLDPQVKTAFAYLARQPGLLRSLREPAPSPSPTPSPAISAEDVGELHAQAYVFQTGRGVPRDLARAAALYRKAADHGWPPAAHQLGEMYLDGWPGQPKDVQEAVKLLEVGVAGDIADSKAVLGDMLVNGKGLPADPPRGFKLMKEAADAGNLIAQNNVATCYKNGLGAAQDPKAGVRYLTLAAERGHVTAQANLAGCYQNGMGVPKDVQKAFLWYERAATAGVSSAQYEVALSYRTGSGAAKDPRKAVEWLRKAAQQNHGEAIKALKETGEK